MYILIQHISLVKKLIKRFFICFTCSFLCLILVVHYLFSISYLKSVVLCFFWLDDNQWTYLALTVANFRVLWQCISGIALPPGSSKLYTGARDGTLRIWDCHTGKCGELINLGAEAGSVICVGPWVFAGLPNAVKVTWFIWQNLVSFTFVEIWLPKLVDHHFLL